MSELNNFAKKFLKDAHAATMAGSFIYATRGQMQALLDAGLVECNEAVAEGNKIAWRTTMLGNVHPVNMPEIATQSDLPSESGAATQETQNETSGEAPHETGRKVMNYELKKVANLDEFLKTSKTGRASKYPFDAMEVGDAFDIEPTAETPEPWKTLASSINTASKRYAKVTGTKTTPSGKTVNVYEFERKFAMRAHTENGKTVARVVRFQ
jgi:hypothetical protein